MWKRNLVFAAVVIAGLSALAASLSPEPRSQVWHRAQSHGRLPAEVRQVVDRVDDAFRTTWQQHNLTPARRADDLTIIRRLSLALAGTIPSLEEIRLLDQVNDQSRVEGWLTTFLAERRTADYLAERLARAFVGTQDGPFIIYRRRRFVNWLSDQLYENHPFDQTVRAMIASTGLWTSDPATNFVTVTVVPAEREEGPDEKVLAARVARAFLAQRIDCAECHDHPFAEWKQSDFQQLAAYFADARVGGEGEGLRGLHDRHRPYQVENRLTGKLETIEPAVPFAAALLDDSPQGTHRAQLASWVTHPQNKAFARATVNRAWAVLFGRPLVEPIDDIPLEAPLPPALDILAEDFAAHGFDYRRLLTVIAATEVFALDSRADDDAPEDSITPKHEAHWAVFPLTRLRPEQVAGALMQAASLRTLDYDAHILLQLGRFFSLQEFVRRYGDAGEQEFDPQSATIPQRLLMMNGRLVREKTRDPLLFTAVARIASLAPDPATAVETAYLAALSRRPTPEESAHFVARLQSTSLRSDRRLEDIYWSLLNSTEFSWNH